jgi:hypothetical protein
MLAAVRDAIESGGFDAAAKRRLHKSAAMLQEALDNSGRLDCSTLAVAAATPRSAVILCAEYGWPLIDAADAVRSRRDADEVAALLAKAIESKTSIPAAVVVGVALLLDLGRAGIAAQESDAERIEAEGRRPLTVLLLAKDAALVTTAAMEERVLN